MRRFQIGWLGVALLVGVSILGACGGGGKKSANTTVLSPTSTTPSSSTSAPPTTAVPATTAPTTAAPTTTVPATTTAPSTSSTTTGLASCSTGGLAITMAGSNGAAGSVYVTLDFRNTGTAACSLFGYPGVSYVTGSSGAQVGSPAARSSTINGNAAEQVVVLAPGALAQVVIQEVDVSNYPPAECGMVAVRGLRVYPPGQTVAAFVPQATNGCQMTGPQQLLVGYVTALS